MITHAFQNFTSLFGVTPASHRIRSQKTRKSGFTSTFGTLKKQPLTERDLLRMESAIGASLFGIITPGHQREFFCLDERTWVWYESWLDAKRVKHEQTTRYEIHSNGIIKVQPDKPYVVLEGDELANFRAAMHAYYNKVMNQIYPDVAVTSSSPAVSEVTPPTPQSEEAQNRAYIQGLYSRADQLQKTEQSQ